MPEKTFLPKEQSTALAALPEIREGHVITGFDAFSAVQFCTPSFVGCRLCIGANVVSGFVTLSVQANTPLGGFSKSFRITNNISFTWNPIGVFKVEFRVTNFRKAGSVFSFNAAIKGCLKLPFIGWKCSSFTHTFSVPTALAAGQQSLLSARADDEAAIESIITDDKDYSNLILVHALLQQQNGCTCEDS